jgi:plastocyanin
MKTIFTSFLSLCLLSVFGQTTHNLTNVGNTFSPAQMTITAGDIVNWVGASNMHNAVQVSQATWTSNGNTPLEGGFWLGLNAPGGATSHTFDTPGTYYYVCIPHASLGMKGQIVVQQGSVEVEESNAAAVAVSLTNLGSGQFLLNGSDLNQLTVFGLNGKLVHSESLIGTDSQRTLNLAKLAGGTYIAVVENALGVNKSIRFVIP